MCAGFSATNILIEKLQQGAGSNDIPKSLPNEIILSFYRLKFGVFKSGNNVRMRKQCATGQASN